MRWPPDSWPWPLVLGLLFAITILMFVASFAVVEFGLKTGALKGPLEAPGNATFLVVAQIATYVPVLALVYVALPHVARLPLRDIGFTVPTGRQVAIGLVGAVLMFLVTLVVGQLVSLAGIKSPEESVAVFKNLTTPPERALFVSIACVFAPIAEEVIFRGILFNGIRRYASTGVAAALSGLVFGLVHISPGPQTPVVSQLLAVALPLFFGGVVLAYVYEISGCYWSNVITHACFNGISVFGLLVLHAT